MLREGRETKIRQWNEKKKKKGFWHPELLPEKWVNEILTAKEICARRPKGMQVEVAFLHQRF